METEAKLPYGSYKTLCTYREQLKADGIPKVLDASTMRTFSGATQSQLRSTLRILNLIGEEGQPTSLLIRFVEAEGEGRTQILLELLSNTYGSLFHNLNGEIDLSGETATTFHSKFRQSGLSGDTVRRAEAFFLSMVTDAGIPIPKRITDDRSSSDVSRKSRERSLQRKSTRATSVDNMEDTEERPRQTTQNDTSAQWKQKMRESMFEKISDKYPAFNPEWDTETQQKWFDGWMKFTEMMERQLAQDDELGEEP